MPIVAAPAAAGACASSALAYQPIQQRPLAPHRQSVGTSSACACIRPVDRGSAPLELSCKDEDRSGPHNLTGLCPCASRTLLTKGYHPICDASQLLSSSLGRLNALMLDERLHQVAHHRPAMSAPPPQPRVEADDAPGLLLQHVCLSEDLRRRDWPSRQ
eukprot:scaffold115829_cov37-Tisochrysis_lutea.AAC.1